jgi:magnesium transporter
MDLELPNAIDQFVEAFHEERFEDARALLPELHAADLAAIFEQLREDERPELVKLVPEAEFADFIHQLPLTDAVEMLGQMPDERLRPMLEDLPDDTIVDILQEMPTETKGHVFHLLSENRRKAARRLLRFPDDSAGGRMTTAFAAVDEEMTVLKAIESLREVKEEAEVLARIYVVDEEGRILGKVRLRDLAFAPPNALISEINDGDTRAVLATADQEKAVRMMSKYDMLSLPVVDEEGRLLGLITHDDALDIQEEESTEDLERQSGIAGDSADETYLNTPLLRHVQRRIGWIISLAFLGLASGYLIFSYQSILSQVFVLSIYMPMIVAAGGNTGGQAATMVIRAMSLGELTPQEFLRVAWREIRVGLIMGSVLGLCMCLQIHYFMPAGTQLPPHMTWTFPITVGLALLCQITTATLIGATLPIAARLAKLDPAVIASPAITTVVDATGLLIYFNLARYFLKI